ncbi:MAG: hypothetical protein Q8M47_15205 [Devosia sp.]|nr:hypothetical protein [Devosia sp.]
MIKTRPPTVHGNLLTVQPVGEPRTSHSSANRSFLLEVKDEASSKVLLASLSMLDRLMGEKAIEVRERRMEEMVDFITLRLLEPNVAEMEMAQRLAARHARVLNEFGYFTAEQLGKVNRSQATVRSALADNWRKRRLVFAVPHPDKTARERDIYPAFQFENHKPIKAMQAVLDAFGEHKDPWKLALWFTSNNGALADDARPVDLLTSDPQAVIEAARRDAAGSAA